MPKPKVWGPLKWPELHLYPFMFPHTGSQQDSTRYQKFVFDWYNNIPCINPCKLKFAEILKSYPPIVTDGQSFFNWGVEVHNMVNSSIGAPTMSHEEARQLWEKRNMAERAYVVYVPRNHVSLEFTIHENWLRVGIVIIAAAVLFSLFCRKGTSSSDTDSSDTVVMKSVRFRED